MPPSDLVGECWPSLSQRLDAGATLSRWAGQEPALGSLQRMADFVEGTAAGADPLRADALLGALVRLAAADGGDDQDAVLVLLNLLAAGSRSLARQLRDVSPDIDFLVAGELTIQIRNFPWRRRTRAYAASLLLDTKLALWRELRPNRRRRAAFVEVLVDPSGANEPGGGWLDRVASASGATTEGDVLDGVDVLDLLCWAERRGVVNAVEVALLIEEAQEHHTGWWTAAATQRVAARHDMSVRSVQRHRARALRRLRAVSREYLDVAA